MHPPGETGRGGGARAPEASKRAGGAAPVGGEGLLVLIGECADNARGAPIGAAGAVRVCRYEDMVRSSVLRITVEVNF